MRSLRALDRFRRSFRSEHARTTSPHRSIWRRIAVAVALLLLVVVTAGTAAWVVSPSASSLAAHVQARLRGTSGRVVAVSELAPILPAAVVATEDERFYHHHGIDILGVIRAIPYDLTHISFAQGASTITEQVAKVLYLGGNDHSPWRKLKDAAVAVKLENRYTKAQILAAYLNSAYFGEGAYGIWAASERYFGLPPRRLGTAQASLLAGLIQAPSLYDPIRHPANARARQVEVLRSLVRTGKLTELQAAAVLARPLRLRGGVTLTALNGVDLSIGPAFVWWQLAVGAVIVSLGAAAFLAIRPSHLGAVRGVFVLRLLFLLVAVIGAAAIIRSFRTA